jgi:GntR family transcriptional repressor for pyruvate dehydrogenase complex
MRAAREQSDPSLEADIDVRLHIAIYEAAHNVVILHVMRALADLLCKRIVLSRDSLYRRHGVRDMLIAQHLRIGEAVLKGDRKAAEAAARGRIDYVLEAHEQIRLDELRQAASLRRFAR